MSFSAVSQSDVQKFTGADINLSLTFVRYLVPILAELSGKHPSLAFIAHLAFLQHFHGSTFTQTEPSVVLCELSSTQLRGSFCPL